MNTNTYTQSEHTYVVMHAWQANKCIAIYILASCKSIHTCIASFVAIYVSMSTYVSMDIFQATFGDKTESSLCSSVSNP